MAEENISQDLRLRNYFIEEINQNNFMSKKYKNSYTVLNQIEHLLILSTVVTGWILISPFASLVGIGTSAEALEMCKITAGKFYNSIRKQKRRNMRQYCKQKG